MNLTEALNLLKRNDFIVESLMDEPIRECTEDEIAKCVALTYNESENKGLTDLSEIIARFKGYAEMYIDSSVLHAYTIDGNQCFILCKPRTSSDGNKIYKAKENYLSLAYVNPEARGTGVAAKLLKKCMQDSPNGLKLDTKYNNIAMIKLAKKLGFKTNEDPKRHSYWITCSYKPNNKKRPK